MKAGLLRLTAVALLGALVVRWLGTDDAESYPALSRDDVIGHVSVRPEIDEFVADARFNEEPQFMKVTNGVYVAVNYAHGNVVFLEGPEGLVVVDTTEVRSAAETIRQKLRTVTDKPIKAIVYSHYHLDHIQGTESFIEDPSNPPEVWAHRTLPAAINENVLVGPRVGRGVVHQFGVALGKQRAFPRLIHGLKPTQTRPPTKFIREDVETLNIAGVNITFIYSPGESPDQLAMWLPDVRVLLSGDNVYQSFPNVYGIRGTARRDCLEWANVVRRLQSLQPDHLVIMHGFPVSGRQKIGEVLTAYGAALQYVHDQTVRHVNRLRHPDELPRLVRLPPGLANHSWLAEMYGGVAWTAKSVYQRYVGWFSGDPVDLDPLTPSERSQRLVDAFGVEPVLEVAEEALSSADHQWGLEMCTHVLRVRPGHPKARRLRLHALRALAGDQLNPTARNYYLTAALDDHQLIDWNTDNSPMILRSSVELLFDIMKVRLKAEMTDNVNVTVVIHFTDSDTLYRLQVVYSVLTVDSLGSAGSVKAPPCDAKLATTEPVWKQIMAGKLAPAAAFNSGDIRVHGDVQIVRHFFSLFD